MISVAPLCVCVHAPHLAGLRCSPQECTPCRQCRNRGNATHKHTQTMGTYIYRLRGCRAARLFSCSLCVRTCGVCVCVCVCVCARSTRTGWHSMCSRVQVLGLGCLRLGGCVPASRVGRLARAQHGTTYIYARGGQHTWRRWKCAGARARPLARGRPPWARAGAARTRPAACPRRS
jgi:hypothetical protein